jgi:LuxR family transcriptional regulator, maltose regulon positive regulatory protein
LTATRPPAPAFRGELVATKLYLPGVRPGHVPRPELLARLASGEAPKLTLLCAPAGWGKSALLSEWHASPDEQRPFAWVSLDPSDDTPVRFWSYVIGALRAVVDDLGQGPLAALPAAGPDLVDVVVAPLINELAASSKQLVLVLDDYHVVHTEPIHASVGFLVRHLPPGVHLAIASRVDPPLPLAALRAAGEVTEIRAADLCFSDAEADALLNGSLGLDLDRPQVELLQARTEGWAAGLRLAALSIEAHEDKRAFIEEFAGDDRQIGDYLHEVLDDQPSHVRDFLLWTSILDRMCAPLCDAVTGGADGAARLEEIERANLFLVPLDSRREWYRYHQLFRDLLRHQLESAEPGFAAELHRRASAWSEEHDLVEEAITHATAAGDFPTACELIARHWRLLQNLGHSETVARWIDALPPDIVVADPRVCLARGWVALVLGQLDVADRCRQAAEAAPAPGRLYDEMPSVAANAALLDATHAYLSGDVRRGSEAGERAVALHPDEDNPGRGVANINLSSSLYYVDRLSDASVALEQGLAMLPQDGWVAPRVNGLGCLAEVYFDLGDTAAAERVTADAERLVDELELGEAPWVTRTRIARGRLLELQGDLTGAKAAFSRALVLARRGGRRLELAHALLLLARLERRAGAHGDARSFAREARQVLAGCRDPGTLRDLLAATERSLQLRPSRAGEPVLPADLELSERELTVLRLLGGELSQREIGLELFISLNTVKGHVRSIFRKLGVTTRAEAVARGRELGLS